MRKFPLWGSSHPHFDTTKILPAIFAFHWMLLGHWKGCFRRNTIHVHFDWATTITSPWSTKTFSWLSSFLPNLNRNWTGAETHRCCFPPVADTNKATLSYVFIIWSRVSWSAIWLLIGDQGHWSLGIFSMRCDSESNRHLINARFPPLVSSTSAFLPKLPSFDTDSENR